MKIFLNSPFSIGSLQLDNRLIQGPLAGFSCAPFRALFSLFHPPAYAVSEMLSAYSVVNHDEINGRYLYRSPEEKKLCYQISGTDPLIMAEAALRLEQLNADLIDINCGCPKPKIRKKGAGSALLENSTKLIAIIKNIKATISIPLTIKIRLQGNNNDLALAKEINDAGADALIIHGRHWKENYDTPCNLKQMAKIKQAITIPVIANGDIKDSESLKRVYENTGTDAFMISRAGTGKPWIFHELLTDIPFKIEKNEIINLFINHLRKLAKLENECKAVLQAKSLIRYYFKNQLDKTELQNFYSLSSIEAIESAFSLNLLTAMKIEC